LIRGANDFNKAEAFMTAPDAEHQRLKLQRSLFEN
jgi:hypothetical protein